ncbi:MAG: DUF2130 domain-containing protein, partial [Ginsengibacter sp.]
MSTLITCPGCKIQFATEDAIAQTLEKEFREKFDNDTQKFKSQMAAREKNLELQLKDFEKKKENENQLFLDRIEKEKVRIQADTQERLRKSIGNDYENQLKMLQESNHENFEKLKMARQKELEFLKKESDLKIKEADLEIEVQKQLAAERISLTEQIRKQEKDRNEIKETEVNLKVRELEKQIDDQKKLVDEMKRKAEQGSMQLQGEVQEMALEET